LLSRNENRVDKTTSKDGPENSAKKLTIGDPKKVSVPSTARIQQRRFPQKSLYPVNP